MAATYVGRHLAFIIYENILTPDIYFSVYYKRKRGKKNYFTEIRISLHDFLE
jgi:hypothetical protein